MSEGDRRTKTSASTAILRFGVLLLVAAAAVAYVLVLKPDGSLAGHDSVRQCYEPVIGGPASWAPGVRLTESAQGVIVDCTIDVPGNPLQGDDVIVSINGVPVSTIDEYNEAVTLGVAGRKPITFEIDRGGERLTLDFSL